jgi:hypothetical protein
MKILIDIDAGPVSCDGCLMLVSNTFGPYCLIFKSGIAISDDDFVNLEFNMPRPPECLQAEQLVTQLKGELNV